MTEVAPVVKKEEPPPPPPVLKKEEEEKVTLVSADVVGSGYLAVKTGNPEKGEFKALVGDVVLSFSDGSCTVLSEAQYAALGKSDYKSLVESKDRKERIARAKDSGNEPDEKDVKAQKAEDDKKVKK